MRSPAPFPSIRRTGLVLAAACALLGASAPQTCARSASVHILLPESTLARGCFDPCLCPILLAEGLRGGFLLTEDTRAPGSPFREFEVKDARWFLLRHGDRRRRAAAREDALTARAACEMREARRRACA